MSADTPYLLRMEMIKLAQERASEKFQAEWSAAAYAAAHKASINENAQYLTEVPEYPDAAKIIAEAKQMKDFVDKG